MCESRYSRRCGRCLGQHLCDAKERSCASSPRRSGCSPAEDVCITLREEPARLLLRGGLVVAVAEGVVQGGLRYALHNTQGMADSLEKIIGEEVSGRI